MLGLRQHVDGEEARLGRFVGHDIDLAGPGELVDADLAEDLALGLVHIGIAGADDLVHGGNGRRAVGHGCDRLRAANPEDPVGAREVAAGDHRRVRIGRQAGDDFLAAGNLRRNDRHHRCRENRIAAAGHIGADALDRNDAVAQVHACQIRDLERKHRCELSLRERLDARNRELGVGAGLRIERRDCGVALGNADLERLAFVIVEGAGILAHRIVAALAHGRDDALHHRLDCAQFLVLRNGGRLDAFDLQMV